MNRLNYWLRGYLRLRLTGAAVSWYLNEATNKDLPFWNVVLCDEFTLEISVPISMREKAAAIANKAMCQMTVLGEYGAPRHYRKVLGRIPLVAVIALAALLSVELSSRVWFFRVEGNETVPSARILRAVQSCGVSYGTRGTDIRPQTIKNEVLEQIEELAWLTVTHNGADAVITVRERDQAPETADRKEYCDLVAKRSGVISSVTVLEGAAAVRVGQNVSEGEVLISGEVPLEQTVRICGAMGEVYAATVHESTVASPKTIGEKVYTGKLLRRISLLVGKKRIKIYEDGGILGAMCDKMTTAAPLALSGDRVLPIALETETFKPFTIQTRELDPKSAEQILCDWAMKTTVHEMVDGTLLRQQCELYEQADAYYADLVLEANEMIAVKSAVRTIVGDTNDRARDQRGTNGTAD